MTIKIKFPYCSALIIFVLVSCSLSNKKPDIKLNNAKEEQDSQISQSENIMNTPDTIITDSNMTFLEAIAGTTAPPEIIEQLVLINVEYYSTDNKLHRGQLVINKSLELDIREIFELIKEIRFPIYQAIPIVAYGWDDDLSMKANNTSSFCYRTVDKTNRLSRHALGKAIDINPYFNPLIWKPPYESKANMPEGAIYDKEKPGTLYMEHPVVQEFKKRKFVWGHYLKKYYDNHHFHKGAPPTTP